MVSYLVVVMVCILNSPMCPMQMENTLGLITAPAPLALAKCYQRGAEMIRDVSQRLPVVNATTVCVDVKEKQVSKAKDDKGKPDEVKPEKNGPPKVNVNAQY